jgi:hypothetical protein
VTRTSDDSREVGKTQQQWERQWLAEIQVHYQVEQFDRSYESAWKIITNFTSSRRQLPMVDYGIEVNETAVEKPSAEHTRNTSRKVIISSELNTLASRIRCWFYRFKAAFG